MSLKWFTVLSAALSLLAMGGAKPAVASSYAQLFAFDGGKHSANPDASLVKVHGKLYGTTYNGGISGKGAVFSLNLATGHEKDIYSFKGGNDGANPEASLIYANSKLYGTTRNGGSLDRCKGGCGTVFSIDPASGAENVVYAFQAGADGRSPSANLVLVGGLLYGTTESGGGSTTCSGGCGTVFSINLQNSEEKVVYSFLGGNDGALPDAGMIDVDHILYGTTTNGGATGGGTVFSFKPSTGTEAIVYSFQSTGGDGCYPDASLLDVDGTLYGTTKFCGSAFDGTVFSLNPTTGAEKVVYSFQGGADGANPEAALTDIGGILYGTTSDGGPTSCSGEGAGCGTLFSLDLATSAEAIAYAFQGGSDGASPHAGLLIDGTTLYGTTYDGGSVSCGPYGCGTIFGFSP